MKNKLVSEIFLMKKRYIILVISLLFFVFDLFSQELSFNLKGILLNAENSEYVYNAEIQLIGTRIFTTSKKDGSFEIGPITQQKFRLKITHLAFQEKLIDLEASKISDKKIVIYLFPKLITLDPVVVSNDVIIIDAESEHSIELKGSQLHQKLGQTIGQTLKNESGIAVRSMGPAPSRPVYRGLGQDRIVITEDDIITNDLSATSPDHAVTVEPFSAERIEILRGPKILLKTSSTIGGLINIVREEIPKQIHNSVHYTVGGYFESANLGRLLSFKTEIPYKFFQSRFEITRRITDDLDTPIGKLKNTYSDNINFVSGLSYIKNGGYVGTSFKFFDLDYGIPGGFIGAHPFGVNIKLLKRQLNLESSWKLNEKSNIKVNFNSSYYRHKEFEYRGTIGSEFRIITNSIGVNLYSKKFFIFHHGIIGLELNNRDFEVGGYVFSPNSRSINLSLFSYQGFTRNGLDLDFAFRLSYDKVTPEKEKFSKRIGWIRERNFFNFSVSLATIYQLTNFIYIGGNISRSSRTPTIEELYSEGPHLAAYSFEVGNPNLKSESGWGGEIFVLHKFEKINFSLTAYYNDINAYIIPRNTGTINYQTFLPVYATHNENVRIFGIENSISSRLLNILKLGFTFSYTIGEFKSTKNPMPQIPPAKGNIEISYNSENLSSGFTFEWAMRQSRIDEFEEPTAGYGVLNYHLQYLFYIGKFISNLSINLDNIFNKEFRNHLSRIKSIYPEPGRNLRVTYKIMI